ncbi:hypothetical protein CW736_05190 [Nonlabens sp. MB-3u-79]|uniref:DUF4270 domain-containing protein n=1 Tax=Nonlabens sp. MB-3u-79 TaxID=2058134 RepID=UPI000C30AA72|nr:DUF4270 domain-containing protein [Nonlabens sp. MB-3u-79]AUC78823.1 hypothetical protein CW736_05190 [Nonlabens sp. MB-3u-79]
MKKMLCKAAIVIVAVLGVVSCENELTPLGANFLGEDPANVIKEAEFDVKTYSVPVNPIQTDNFNSFPFGVYDDPTYGRSTYSLVTQIDPNFTSPSFGQNKVVEEVILEVPYFSRLTGVNGEDSTYRIDSLYGMSPVHLQIFRSNYFLNSFDPQDVTQNAVYYSNFESTIDMNRGDLIYENISFLPDPAEIDLLGTNDEGDLEVTERLTPRLRVSLPIDYWETVIIDQEGSANLASVSNFQDYFRGLYFKVAGATNSGNLIHLDMNNALIDIKVNSDFPDISDFDEDGDTTELNNITSNFRLNFNGNKIVFINNDFSPSILSDIAGSNDPINGAENIYLKGGPGSIAVIELFGQATNSANGEAQVLSDIIANDWLINEASIEFYVDQSNITGGESEPERIFIYDYDENRILADFALSGNGTSGGVNTNINHLGRLERVITDDLSSDGVKYKIVLTQHVSNIIRGNIDNNRLAIVSSQNVALVGSNKVLNTMNPNPDLTTIPLSAALSHEGTVLHGNLSTDIDKRPKLILRYSETTN